MGTAPPGNKLKTLYIFRYLALKSFPALCLTDAVASLELNRSIFYLHSQSNIGILYRLVRIEKINKP